MNDDSLVRKHDIKGPDSKEIEIEALLRKPGVEQKITAIAATLAELFSVQTKLLLDLRPGAVFIDEHTNTKFVYEATIAPYDFDAITTLILRKAMQPIEELEDQGYVTFRVHGINGTRNMMALRDFIKLFAIDRFKVTDLNISDEQEIAKKAF